MSQLLYIFLMMIVLLLSYLARRTEKNFFLYILILLLAFVAGFRGQFSGIDTPSYYENISKGFPYSWMFREEGFRLIANYFMDTFGNPQLMFLFCAVLTNLLIVLRIWDYRKEARFDFMILLYITLFFPSSLNIMRQFVAIALVFYGTRFLKGNKLLFIPFLVASFYFHRSSLLAIGYIIISMWSGFSKKQKQIFAAPMVFIIVASVMYVSTYLVSDVESYSSQRASNINITFFYLLFITLFSFVMYISNKKIKFSTSSVRRTVDNYKIDNTITIYTLLGLAFSSLSLFFSFVGRTGIYYSIFYIIYWGIASSRFKNSGLNRVLILIYAFYLFGLVVFRNDAAIFPYIIYFY